MIALENYAFVGVDLFSSLPVVAQFQKTLTECQIEREYPLSAHEQYGANNANDEYNYFI